MNLLDQLKEEGIPYLFSVQFDETLGAAPPSRYYKDDHIDVLPSRYYSVELVTFIVEVYENSGELKQGNYARSLSLTFENHQVATTTGFMKLHTLDGGHQFRIFVDGMKEDVTLQVMHVNAIMRGAIDVPMNIEISGLFDEGDEIKIRVTIEGKYIPA